MYRSIHELPTVKWWDINDTGDYSLLLRDKIELTKEIYDKCENVWDEINQQHIDRFGLPPSFINYWRELSNLYTKKIKATLNGGSDESHYEFAQLRFDQQYKDKKKVNNYKLKATIEKVLGIPRIDPHTMPIIEFSTLVELANETATNG